MDELRHYGIIGMKWGVRRTPEELARIRSRIGDDNYKIIKDKYGEKSLIRINDRMDDGYNLSDAMKKESIHKNVSNAIKFAAKTGVSIAATKTLTPIMIEKLSPLLADVGSKALSKIVTPETIAAGREMVSKYITPDKYAELMSWVMKNASQEDIRMAQAIMEGKR